MEGSELSFHETRVLWASAAPSWCVPASAKPQGSWGPWLPFGKAAEWLWKQTDPFRFVLWGGFVYRQNGPCAWVPRTRSCPPKGRGACGMLSRESCQHSTGLCKQRAGRDTVPAPDPSQQTPPGARSVAGRSWAVTGGEAQPTPLWGSRPSGRAPSLSRQHSARPPGEGQGSQALSSGPFRCTTRNSDPGSLDGCGGRRLAGGGSSQRGRLQGARNGSRWLSCRLLPASRCQRVRSGRAE